MLTPGGAQTHAGTIAALTGVLAEQDITIRDGVFKLMQTRLSWGQKPRVCPMKLSTSDGVVIVSFSMILLVPFTLVLLFLLRLLVVGVVLVGDHPLGRGAGVQLGEPATAAKTSSAGNAAPFW
jgi:hypothetical protein